MSTLREALAEAGVAEEFVPLDPVRWEYPEPYAGMPREEWCRHRVFSARDAERWHAWFLCRLRVEIAWGRRRQAGGS